MFASFLVDELGTLCEFGVDGDEGREFCGGGRWDRGGGWDLVKDGSCVVEEGIVVKEGSCMVEEGIVVTDGSCVVDEGIMVEEGSCVVEEESFVVEEGIENL